MSNCIMKRIVSLTVWVHMNFPRTIYQEPQASAGFVLSSDMEGISVVEIWL